MGYPRLVPITLLFFIAVITAANADAAVATWDRNPEPDVTGYVLSYGTQSGQHTTAIDVGNVLRYEFFPPPGQRYYVVVQAYNSSGGLGPKSAEVIYDAPTSQTNRAPTLTQPSNQTSAIGSPVSVALSASDPDGQTLTFTATALPPGLNINTTSGVISGTPTIAGTYPVVATASDGLLSSSRTFTWTITSTNRTPTLTRPVNQTNNAGDSVNLQLSASDPDGTPVSFSAANLPSGLTLGSSSGLISGVLQANSAGQYNVTVTVSDGQLTASQSFAWTVNGSTTSATDIPVGGDYDGDGRADLATWRPSTGEWRLRVSGNSYATGSAIQWGISTDLPAAADYDGDRRTDIAVFRPSNGVWYVLLSTTNYQARMDIQWGDSQDRPVPVDYDNDGRADLVLPRAGAFQILLSRSNYASSTTVSAPQLLASDVAVRGDFDGDGRADLAAYRPSSGEWRRWLSGNNFAMAAPIQWGLSTDVPVPADYDGDRRADITAYRPSNGVWYVLLSTTNYQARVDIQWGGSQDRPMPVDYDHDGRADLAVLRSSGFAILRSSGNYGSSVTVP